MILFQDHIPAVKWTKIVNLYAEDNETEMTNDEYTEHALQEIVRSDIRARARNRVAEAAEDITF